MYNDAFWQEYHESTNRLTRSAAEIAEFSEDLTERMAELHRRIDANLALNPHYYSIHDIRYMLGILERELNPFTQDYIGRYLVAKITEVTPSILDSELKQHVVDWRRRMLRDESTFSDLRVLLEGLVI